MLVDAQKLFPGFVFQRTSCQELGFWWWSAGWYFDPVEFYWVIYKKNDERSNTEIFAYFWQYKKTFQ